MEMLKKITLAVLASVCLFSASAEELKYSESDYGLCYELFEVMKMDQHFRKTMDMLLELQMKSNPALQMFRPEMEQFFHRYGSFQELKKPLARVYLDMFTADDIREYIRFYRTPAGGRLAERTSELSGKAAELGRMTIEAHLPELQEILRNKAERMGRRSP